jgi:hypothetical protein
MAPPGLRNRTPHAGERIREPRRRPPEHPPRRRSARGHEDGPARGRGSESGERENLSLDDKQFPAGGERKAGAGCRESPQGEPPRPRDRTRRIGRRRRRRDVPVGDLSPLRRPAGRGGGSRGTAHGVGVPPLMSRQRRLRQQGQRLDRHRRAGGGSGKARRPLRGPRGGDRSGGARGSSSAASPEARFADPSSRRTTRRSSSPCSTRDREAPTPSAAADGPTASFLRDPASSRCRIPRGPWDPRGHRVPIS